MLVVIDGGWSDGADGADAPCLRHAASAAVLAWLAGCRSAGHARAHDARTMPAIVSQSVAARSCVAATCYAACAARVTRHAHARPRACPCSGSRRPPLDACSRDRVARVWPSRERGTPSLAASTKQQGYHAIKQRAPPGAARTCAWRPPCLPRRPALRPGYASCRRRHPPRTTACHPRRLPHAGPAAPPTMGALPPPRRLPMHAPPAGIAHAPVDALASALEGSACAPELFTPPSGTLFSRTQQIRQIQRSFPTRRRFGGHDDCIHCTLRTSRLHPSSLWPLACLTCFACFACPRRQQRLVGQPQPPGPVYLHTHTHTCAAPPHVELPPVSGPSRSRNIPIHVPCSGYHLLASATGHRSPVTATPRFELAQQQPRRSRRQRPAGPGLLLNVDSSAGQPSLVRHRPQRPAPVPLSACPESCSFLIGPTAKGPPSRHSSRVRCRWPSRPQCPSAWCRLQLPGFQISDLGGLTLLCYMHVTAAWPRAASCAQPVSESTPASPATARIGWTEVRTGSVPSP